MKDCHLLGERPSLGTDCDVSSESTTEYDRKGEDFHFPHFLVWGVGELLSSSSAHFCEYILLTDRTITGVRTRRSASAEETRYSTLYASNHYRTDTLPHFLFRQPPPRGTNQCQLAVVS
jgi:hypothetical protein